MPVNRVKTWCYICTTEYYLRGIVPVRCFLDCYTKDSLSHLGSRQGSKGWQISPKAGLTLPFPVREDEAKGKGFPLCEVPGVHTQGIWLLYKWQQSHSRLWIKDYPSGYLLTAPSPSKLCIHSHLTPVCFKRRQSLFILTQTSSSPNH